jgi:hypothetical protein
MVDILAEKPVTWSNPIQYMILRARFNEQRNYEIYTFHTSIKEEDLIREFEERPQVIVDAIRRVGKKLYGVEKSKGKNVIV